MTYATEFIEFHIERIDADLTKQRNNLTWAREEADKALAQINTLTKRRQSLEFALQKVKI